MTFEMGTLVALVVAVVTAAIGYGKLQNKNEGLAAETENLWREIGKTRAAQAEHDKDSSATRLEIERELGRLRETISSKDGKMDEIIRRLGVIDEKVDRIETRGERGDVK